MITRLLTSSDEDIAAAAGILKGKHIAPYTRLIIVPASNEVLNQCIQKGRFTARKSSSECNDILSDNLVVKDKILETLVLLLEVKIHFRKIRRCVFLQLCGQFRENYLFNFRKFTDGLFVSENLIIFFNRENCLNASSLFILNITLFFYHTLNRL